MTKWKTFLNVTAKQTAVVLNDFLGQEKISAREFSMRHFIRFSPDVEISRHDTTLSMYCRMGENSLAVLALLGAGWKVYETEDGIACILTPFSRPYNAFRTVRAAEDKLRKELLGGVALLAPGIDVDAKDCAQFDSLEGYVLVRQPKSVFTFELRRK